MGDCCLMSEQLRMDLAQDALWRVDAISASLCFVHVKILKDSGDGRGAFNMLLHYEIEHPDWFARDGILGARTLIFQGKSP